MAPNFRMFVVFAEMRTGSNFLESNINAFTTLKCHGEAFNPHFIGYPNADEILGLTLEDRHTNPEALLDRIADEEGILGGFRYFHDHDPRVLERILEDPLCAKIILTRNPVDSYVSWKIAQATDQWKLTNVKRRKSEQITFDPQEFESHLSALQEFQITLLNKLQTSGQTAFYIAYEDLRDLGVINGLAKFLGTDEQLTKLDEKLKVQNPDALSKKVANFDAMEASMTRLDRFNLNRTPNFEPRRHAAVPSFVAAPTSPLLFMPIRSGPAKQVKNWLAALDHEPTSALHNFDSQKPLRQWFRSHVPHRSFTVVRHPVARAYHAFCHKILSTGPGAYMEIRRTLSKFYRLDLPADPTNKGYTRDRHRATFLMFLDWVKANLNGQTAQRVDAHWASQSAVIQGFANFTAPDAILREDRLAEELAWLATQIGAVDAPEPQIMEEDYLFALSDIYDDEIEAAARDAYQRDYSLLGFADWG